MSTYLAPLKESTILAMSNLLSANVDAGLKYSLSMGYHDDPQMRTAYMKVLTNILNQGTEFETLAETVITDRYEKLVDVSIHLCIHSSRLSHLVLFFFPCRCWWGLILILLYLFVMCALLRILKMLQMHCLHASHLGESL